MANHPLDIAGQRFGKLMVVSRDGYAGGKSTDITHAGTGIHAVKVVMCSGTFDPVHFGHLLHLEAASEFGDALVVALTSDVTVRKEKGEKRPLFPQAHRRKLLEALRCVDAVAVVDSMVDGLLYFRPDVLVKGCDYAITGLEEKHREFCEAHGIEVRFTDTPKWSATEIGDELRRR